MDVWIICGRCGYKIRQIASNARRIRMTMSLFEGNCYQCGSNELHLDASVHVETPQTVEMKGLDYAR